MESPGVSLLPSRMSGHRTVLGNLFWLFMFITAPKGFLSVLLWIAKGWRCLCALSLKSSRDLTAETYSTLFTSLN